MKRKIFALFFAAVLCLGVSFSSLGFVSSASELETTKPVNGDFSLTPEEYKKIQDGLIDMVLSWHGYTYEECALEFFNTMYEMMIVDEFHYSGNPPREYDGNRPMFSSEGVWNPDYVVAYESGQLHIWGFSYSIEEFEEYIAARLSAETAAEDFVPDKSDIKTPISVGTDFFKDALKKGNNTLTPKNRTMHKYSWRELSDTQQYYKGDYLARAVGKNGKFVDDTSYEDGIYIQPYAILGDVEDINGKNCRGEYYSPYQYRLYCVKSAAPVDSGYEFEYQWKIDALYYQIDNGERLDVQTVDLVSWYVDYPYVTLGFGYSSYYQSLLSFWFYDDYNNVVNSPYTPFFETFGQISSASFYNSVYENFLLSTDTSVSFLYNHFLAYVKNADFTDITAYTTTTLSQFQEKGLNDNISDYGLLVSNTPFSTTFLFDITRLPDNATVTISGDSVYDYSITDNSTGDTSTIYNYVTNNYNYPDNSGGNTSGGNGGIIGGNITVGGQVDVGGKVDVNVNINNGGNGNNYSMPDTSGMNDFLESALDESTGIRKFLKVFFDFLPPPILALLGVALTCAIISRLLGR